MVLEVITRTAGRSIYSYNRSVLVPLEAPMLALTGAPDLKVYDMQLTGGWRGCDDGHRRHAGTHR